VDPKSIAVLRDYLGERTLVPLSRLLFTVLSGRKVAELSFVYKNTIKSMLKIFAFFDWSFSSTNRHRFAGTISTDTVCSYSGCTTAPDQTQEG